jgi:hypothetical protein
MKDKKQNHGGKREGSGRKSIPANLKKQLFSLALPPYLIRWMDNQPESRAKLIEISLKKQYEISDPTFSNLTRESQP